MGAPLGKLEILMTYLLGKNPQDPSRLPLFEKGVLEKAALIAPYEGGEEHEVLLIANLNNIAVGTTDQEEWTVDDWDPKEKNRDLYLSAIYIMIHEPLDYLKTYLDSVGVELFRNVQNQLDHYFLRFYKDYTGFYDTKYRIWDHQVFERIRKVDKEITLRLAIRSYGSNQIDAYVIVWGFLVG